MRKYVDAYLMMKKFAYISSLFLSVAMLVSAQPQASYYTASTLDGKNGRALELALQSIVYPHTRLSYNYLWKAYEITDPGPTDSISASYHGGNTQLVYDMYSWMKWFPKFYEDGDHSQTGGINREHCVPNSWWGGEDGNAIAYTDLHHLFPADGAANNAKGNYPLGEYISGLTLSWPTETRTYQGTAYMDAVHVCSRIWDVPSNKQSNFGGAAKVFEPADMYKGDFARAYLYVVCAYEKKLTWQTTQNTMFENDAQGYTDIENWALNMLLTWHRNDPVSPKERDRNNAVEELQGNRNPFIDYPELVEYIWGNKTSQAFSLANATCSYNSVYYPVTIVDMEGGAVTASPASALAGETVTLTAIPDEVHLFSNQTASWSVLNGSTPITVTIGANNTCTFVMPAHAVTVSADFEDNPQAVHNIFLEDFSGITAGDNITTDGSNSKWNYNSNFSDTTAVYQAGGAIKLGTGKRAGSITTKALDLSVNNGKFMLSFDVKGWTSVEGNIIVTITGQENQTFTYVAKMSDAFQTVEHLYTGGVAGATIKFATTAKRAFIDNIRVYYTDGMKPAPVSGWNKASYVAIIDGENEFPTYTNGNNEIGVTYSSSNTHVATVNAEGVVTAHSVGTTTISASTPETVTYKSLRQSYVLTVVSLDGEGTEDNPFTVADVLALRSSRPLSAWVSGIIAGWPTVDGVTEEKPNTGASSSIALSDDEVVSNSIAVKLPMGGSIRRIINLVDNKSAIGKTVCVYGTLGDYFAHPGINGEISRLKIEDETVFSISSAEWATFYSDTAYVMPAGVTGYKVNYANNALTLVEVKTEGQTVPANSPLLLSGAEGTYTYAVMNSTAVPITSNLYGNLTEGTIGAVDGMTYYYKLLKPEGESLGWYWGSETGGVFSLGANKAYLALPAEASSAPMHFFALEEIGSATSFEELTEWQTAIDWEKPVYNVLGQLVSCGYRGFVFQNGVKYLAR